MQLSRGRPYLREEDHRVGVWVDGVIGRGRVCLDGVGAWMGWRHG